MTEILTLTIANHNEFRFKAGTFGREMKIDGRRLEDCMVGRSPDVQVEIVDRKNGIDDSPISRLHLMFSYVSDVRIWKVADQESSYGTTMRGERDWEDLKPFHYRYVPRTAELVLGEELRIYATYGDGGFVASGPRTRPKKPSDAKPPFVWPTSEVEAFARVLTTTIRTGENRTMSSEEIRDGTAMNRKQMNDAIRRIWKMPEVRQLMSNTRYWEQDLRKLGNAPQAYYETAQALVKLDPTLKNE